LNRPNITQRQFASSIVKSCPKAEFRTWHAPCISLSLFGSLLQEYHHGEEKEVGAKVWSRRARGGAHGGEENNEGNAEKWQGWRSEKPQAGDRHRAIQSQEERGEGPEKEVVKKEEQLNPFKGIPIMATKKELTTGRKSRRTDNTKEARAMRDQGGEAKDGRADEGGPHQAKSRRRSEEEANGAER